MAAIPESTRNSISLRLLDGLPAGTPQEALDTACTIHLTGPSHEPDF
jgi:hypothetical protein